MVSTPPQHHHHQQHHYGLLVGAALIFTIVWFGLLAGRALYDPDEGRYAEIPREMLAGDNLIPHLNGLIYLEKPPLQYWITALAYRLFGESEGIARLWTGVTGYLSLGLVFLLGRQLWGFDAGLKALTLTAGSVLFVLLGHQLTLDMSMSFLLLGSLACFLLAQTQREFLTPRPWRLWMLGSWVFMAFAVLTKGLIGVLIPGATLVLYGFWQRDREIFKFLNIRWGFPLFLLIAAPWFILAARANKEFLQFFFVREHFQRFLTPIEHRTEPWWFFVAVLIIGVLPWIAEAVRALWRTLKKSSLPRRFDAERVLWVWCVFVMVFFSLSDSKLIPYILPVVPALALLCSAPSLGESRLSTVLGSSLSLIAAVGILAYASARWSSAGGRALALQLQPILTLSGVFLAAVAGFCLVLAWQRVRIGRALLCGAWFCVTVSILQAGVGAERFFSAKEMAMAIRSRSALAVPVFAVRTYDQSLPFYLKQTVVLVDYRDEFALGLGQEPQKGMATVQEFAQAWRTLEDGFAVMPDSTWAGFQAQGLPMHEIARFSRRVLVQR